MRYRKLIKGSIFLIILICLLIFPFLYLFCNVSGDSMYPTLRDKDYLLVCKVSDIDRGDIVIIKKDNSKKYLVKRVIGVSGDEIRFEKNNLYINGKLVYEDYINKDEDIVYNDYSETISDGYYYVLGDNRNHSGDSRQFGGIAESEIKGEVKLNLTNLGITNNIIRISILLLIIIIIRIFE